MPLREQVDGNRDCLVGSEARAVTGNTPVTGPQHGGPDAASVIEAGSRLVGRAREGDGLVIDINH